MKYYKAKNIATKYTTSNLVVPYGVGSICYHNDGEIYYWGVNADIDLAAQHPECEVKELTFEQIQPILNNCRLMKEINEKIESAIAEKYSPGAEIGMLKKDKSIDEYIAYQNYVSYCKDRFRKLKIQFGLVQ